MNKIRFYNCKFGDCFRIPIDNNSYLFVDYGIRRIVSNKHEKYKIVKEDIFKLDEGFKKEFLLTHFHEDHYSGLLDILNFKDKGRGDNTTNKHCFDIFYLPDVWDMSDSCSSVTITEILHAYHFYQGLIFGRVGRKSIIDILIGVCNNNGRVVFLKKNDTFHNNTVLWPQINPISSEAIKIKNEIINSIENLNIDKIIKEDFLEKTIPSITKQTTKLVDAINVIKEISNNNYSQVLPSLKSINDDFKKLRKSMNKDICKYIWENHKGKLNDFGNSVSLVFHSQGDNRILFTGDIPKDIMETHISPTIQSIKYSIIKIPHHGTTNYYYDFKDNFIDNETKLLIPNDNSIGNAKIDKRYHEDVKGKAIHLYKAISPFQDI
ncbi:MAG: hypothetical protein HUK24_02200 [Sphaerochaetaceae bacterium]|nr:hypothetical protein [Sphaerochaetaceae bacterium]